MFSFATIGLKLAGLWDTIIKLASAIPWYVWSLIVCGIVIFAAEHKISAKNAEIAKNKASYANSLSAWKQTNATNFASVQTLINADQLQNATITAYVGREAEASRLAAAYKVKADKAAASRDKALTILKNAKPIKSDCAAPPEHVEVKDQL